MPPHCIRRREYEFAEFLDPAYRWFIKTVSRVDDESIQATLQDGRVVAVKRSTDYLMAPKISIDGSPLTGGIYEFYPALTTVRWLMMLLFVEPDIKISSSSL